MNRKQKILLVLVGVLAISLAYRLANPFRQATVDRLTYAPARTVTASEAKANIEDATNLRIDLLQSPPQTTVAVRRDPFQTPRAAEPSAIVEQRPPQPAPLPIPQSLPEKIKEHFGRFKTFGSFRHGEKTYLFLERGKQVLVVTEGDRIDGKYEILAVAEKSVTISAEDIEKPLKIDFEEL